MLITTLLPALLGWGGTSVFNRGVAFECHCLVFFLNVHVYHMTESIGGKLIWQIDRWTGQIKTANAMHSQSTMVLVPQMCRWQPVIDRCTILLSHRRRMPLLTSLPCHPLLLVLWLGRNTPLPLKESESLWEGKCRLEGMGHCMANKLQETWEVNPGS